jgi:L-asparaginase II
VYSILRKIGLDESYLQCGAHAPIHRPTARRLAAQGKKSTAVHCNCSGKHSGMLALSVMLGVDPRTYLDVDGPVQKTILDVASEMMGVRPDSVILGIDGCGVPAYGVPLYAMALGFARISDPSGLSRERSWAIDTVSSAMRSHPQMVAGTGRFTTDLLLQAGDRILAKSGAEAVYCMALVGKGIGVAFKVGDGSSRPIPPAAIEILRQLEVLEPVDLDALAGWRRPVVSNLRGEVCGEVRPAVELVTAG